jgi:hypothetical protein
MDWAIAGAASVPAAAIVAPPTPAVRRNLRRCIEENSLRTLLFNHVLQREPPLAAAGLWHRAGDLERILRSK